MSLFQRDVTYQLRVSSEEAMRIAGIPEPSKQYFVDDSALNVKGAKNLGWKSYLFDEEGTAKVQPEEVDGIIRSLQGTCVQRKSQEKCKYSLFGFSFSMQTCVSIGSNSCSQHRAVADYSDMTSPA